MCCSTNVKGWHITEERGPIFLQLRDKCVRQECKYCQYIYMHTNWMFQEIVFLLLDIFHILIAVAQPRVLPWSWTENQTRDLPMV